MDRTKQRAGLSEDRRKRVRAIGTALCIVTGMALACAFAWNPIKQLVSDPEGFRSFVAEQGVWGPVLFVGLMAFQILVAVLPGEPLEIAAGYTFGVWGGTALCMAGALVGSAAVFLLVRAWGRPAAELFFPREKLESLPFLRDERKSTLLTFLLFLIPGTPKDLMTYAVGLTNMRFSIWLLISTFARIPSIVTSTAGGDALGMQNYEFAAVAFVAALAIGGAGLWIYRSFCRRWEKEGK